MADLTFFDSNVFLGKHENPYAGSPFTPVAAQSLLGAQDRLSGMLVFHSSAKLYDAPHGNRRLLEETEGREGLHRMWVALPDVAGNEHDAARFVSEMRHHSVEAVRIFPRTHNFTLMNQSLDPLLSMLNEKAIPLFSDQEEISWEEVHYVVKSFPKLPFVLTNAGYRLGRYIDPLMRRYQTFHLEISRYQVHRGLEELCRKFGSERLLFGSGLPVFSPEPVMMLVESASISSQDRQNIAGANLRRILRRD